MDLLGGMNMENLLLTLFVWISTYTPFPMDDVRLPVVKLTTPEAICMKATGAEECTSVAYYIPETNEITLRNTFDVNNVRDQSLLLHEVIHYVQDVYSVPHVCASQHEAEAYNYQNMYLAQHDERRWINYRYVVAMRACLME